jgi:mono/diheme cytochrome c family protein
MPSDISIAGDDDLAALVAYVHACRRQRQSGQLRLPVPVRATYGSGWCRRRGEDRPRPAPQPAVPEGLTLEHGRYVGQGCTGCHGPNLSGGRVPGAPPDWPAAANLTPGEGSAMARYPQASDFQTMLRTGHRPDGSAVSPVMPFSALSKMSSVDTGALYLYLKALPPRAAGQH